MLRNHIKITFRNFTRNPLYTSINVLGLVIGITFSLLLFLGIQDEMSIDRFHEDGERLYRSYFNGVDKETKAFTFTQPSCPYPLYTTLLETNGVENAAYFDDWGDVMMVVGDKSFKQEVYWGTPSMFEIFSFPLIEGNLEKANTNLETVFVSEDIARKFFGKYWQGNTIGKTIEINKDLNVQIAAVFENIGKNSTYRFDVLLNAKMIPGFNDAAFMDDWGRKGATVFSKLNENIDPRGIEKQINAIYEGKPGYGVGGEAMMLFPLEDNHLWTKFEAGVATGGQIEYVRIFFGAALFLLLIACINFINLATAQASKRAKEVGVRKTVGAGKSSLVFQFLSETGVLIALAIFIALWAVNLLLPTINDLTEKAMAIPIGSWAFWLSISGLGLLLTLLAGLYPSFILSRFRPVLVLKNNLSSNYAHKNIRRGLVVFQFVLSAILIISTIVVHHQIDFIKNENLGLNRNNVIHLHLPRPVREKYEPLKNKLEESTSVTHILKTSSLPTNINEISVSHDWEGRNPDDGAYFYMFYTEFGFDQLFDIEMKEGRFFDENIQTDINGVVINEKALDYINMENPVGKTVSNYDGQPMTILGIAKNFNFRSIHHDIEPLMMRVRPNYTSHLFIKSKPEATAETLALLQSTWSELVPDYPLEYNFLDETYARMYTVETIIGQLSWYLAAIAIIISCLGLFGLVTFMAGQKTKEIGIRKVLGASVLSIVGLLSKDFVKLITLGLLIAMPLAWFGMNTWLENYAYRVEIEWQVFALAGILAIGIALLTISFQSIKAALANPVKALKSE